MHFYISSGNFNASTSCEEMWKHAILDIFEGCLNFSFYRGLWMLTLQCAIYLPPSSKHHPLPGRVYPFHSPSVWRSYQLIPTLKCMDCSLYMSSLQPHLLYRELATQYWQPFSLLLYRILTSLYFAKYNTENTLWKYEVWFWESYSCYIKCVCPLLLS